MCKRIVIVGAGQAGFATAAKLREQGFGGTVTLIGDEPGLPYQRPPLSKAYLMGTIGAERLLLRDRNFYSDNNIQVVIGERVTFIDRTSKVVSTAGRQLPYDQLVLATGARPIWLPASMSGRLERIFCLRTMDDADRLRPMLRVGARLLVVGGGYVGLEVGAAARQAGADVTLVEAAPRILNRVAAEATAAYFRALHQSRGVRIFEGKGLAGLTGSGGAIIARLSDGTQLDADAVIVGIGVRPSIELAAETGLKTADGISVDAFGRTSDPCIWAAGDCASFDYRGETLRIESVPHAIDQAEHVALNMLGLGRPYRPKPWFWSDQYGSKLQIAGLNRGFDRVETSVGPSSESLRVSYFKRDELLSVDCINDPGSFMSARRQLERQS